jgi:predicted nucleotidyltransferase component of viral defense system
MINSLFKNCYLVGGTSLALQMGHRHSIDIDLFSDQSINNTLILEYLEKQYQVQPLTNTEVIFICVVNGIKLDCVFFRYPLLFPVLNIEGIRMADMKDIAPMKLDAIAKRGSKKDFIDLYYLLQRFSLSEMLTWYQSMFKHSTSFHIVKSLSYFEDAENDAMPLLFDQNISWKNIKDGIKGAIKTI